MATNDLEAARQVLADARRIVAFTGAGISTDSGIPDLAGIERILRAEPDFHGGGFTMLDPDFAQREPAVFYHLYRQTFFHPQAQPNAAHRFLAQLARQGLLAGIVTMNIDGLHQRAGSQHVIEYWGDMRLNRCVQCQRCYDWDLAVHQPVPHCPICGGLVLPDFVLRRLAAYSDAEWAGEHLLQSADVILIIGTQRQAASFPDGTPKIVVNQRAQPVRGRDTVMLTGNAAEICRQLATNLTDDQVQAPMS